MTDKELLQKYEAYCSARMNGAIYLLTAYEFWEKNNEHDVLYLLILWGYYRTQCNDILNSLNYRDYDRLCDLAGSIV